MAYQLKTTGIAANCTMCIAVDPDTDEIKDFASASVTSTMSIGGSITVGSQAWDGNTRKYFQLAASNYVAFGTNKPTFNLNSSTAQNRTVVWIGECEGGTPMGRAFGENSGDYAALINLGGSANTHPTMRISSGLTLTGGLTNPSTGTKKIYGFALNHNGSISGYAYSATDTDSSMTQVSVSGAGYTPSYTLDYVGRRDDSTSQNNDKIHAVLIFNAQLSQAQFDSLRDDWFGTLLEVSGGTTHNVTIANSSQANVASTGSIAIDSTTYVAGSSSTQPNVCSTGAIYSAAGGTLTTPPLKNNTGTLLVSETGATAFVYNVSTGALVVSKTGQSTNASGVMTINDALIVATTQYRVVVVLGSGAEGMDKLTAS